MSDTRIQLPHTMPALWDRVTVAMKRKISDYTDVDKIIAYVTDDNNDDNSREYFSPVMYMYHRNEPDDNFTNTNTYPRDQVKKILSYMQRLVLMMPNLFAQQKYLRRFTRGANCHTTLTRMQIATIIAAMFFGVFDTPTQLFTTMHKSLFRVSCLLQYFNRLYSVEFTPTWSLTGDLIIRRRSLTESQSHVRYADSNVRLGRVAIMPAMRELHTVQADIAIYGVDELNRFAAQRPHHRCNEDAIMFACPELLILSLCCENLQDDEAIAVMGAERFCEVEGRNDTLKYVRAHVDTSPRSSDGTITRAYVFIDPTTNTSNYTEFTKEFDRDLRKLIIGCNIMKLINIPGISVATMDFGGHIPHDTDPSKHSPECCNMGLKFIQLYLATSICGLDLIYCSANETLVTDVTKFLSYIHANKFNVSMLYSEYKKIENEIRRDVLNSYNNIDIGSFNILNAIIYGVGDSQK